MLDSKEPPGEDGVKRVRGLRVSEAMVTTRPKCESEDRSSLNWETSS
jgi:hypothetical protein